MALVSALDPDDHGTGLSDGNLTAERYDYHPVEPWEVGGTIRAMMPSNSRILDVGCGTGSVTIIANQGLRNDVFGIEPNAERASIARAKGLKVETGVLSDNYVRANGQFDVVMAADVLEHTSSPSEFLDQMVRLAKPGGQIILSVPNVAHWTVRTQLMFGNFDYEPTGIMDATHLRWFTEKTLKKLLSFSSLEVKELRQTATPSLPAYGRGILGRIPSGFKTPLITSLTKAFRRLFGVQHVVRAGRL